MFDTMPEAPTCADYGIDNAEIFATYQRAIRNGHVNADQLHAAILSDEPGQELSKLLQDVAPGITINSVYDMFSDL